MSNTINRCLLVYAGVLTAAVSVALLTGAAGSTTTSFEQIDVQRLNLREPDGTLRYVLSSSARFPGAILGDTEYPHPRPQAGMLFYNDEGAEVGGLIFAGARDADGTVSSGGSLTFDRYEQDQIVQILGLDQAGQQVAGMQVSDRPDRSIRHDFAEADRLDAMPNAERDALLRERNASGYYGAGRLFVGRARSGDAVLQLSDGAGKPRMVLRVTEAGVASLDFLDADGQVVRSLTPEQMAAQQ
ncbi:MULTISPECIES: hypothetical protein [Luteimonas]|uniref:hypothetical protein n=1 Tax=Luteimonas TaxID=83614 RepID=UPI000C79B880|nr:MULTISPECIES: hypothetical protein [Luteimonas]